LGVLPRYRPSPSSKTLAVRLKDDKTNKNKINMKTEFTFKITALLTAFLILMTTSNSIAQIANNYPNDSLIQNDPAVIFTEMFEQNSISTMISSSNYQTSQMLSHINFDSSVPIGSHGTQSLKLTTVENSNLSNDPNEDANILKKFTAGITDSVFIRYYVKFNNGHAFHHTGVWMGGTNPTNSCWPCNIPGRTIPTSGDSAFVIGTEIRGAATQSAQAFSKFGFYNYWMGMKPYTTGPNAGKYYGNEFISPNTNANLDMTSWNCIETMIKLNNPNDSTGELKLWINGQLMAHYGKGFPNGTWNEAFFNEGSGNPFEGFRWRSNPSVVFNYIWIKNYSTNNGSYPSNNDVLYDHIVVAKKYIGPIATSSTTGLTKNTVLNDVYLYPNPANQTINFSTSIKKLSIINTLGQIILEANEVSNLSTETFEEGLYIIHADNKIYKLIIKR
jgi:hypothetical protein